MPDAQTPPPRPVDLSLLGPALRRLRQTRHLKQYEAARLAGVTKAMLSAYETGRRLPAVKTLARLLRALRSDLRALHEAMEWAEQERARQGRGGEPPPSPLTPGVGSP